MTPTATEETSTTNAPLPLTSGQRVLLIASNYIPFLNVIIIVTLFTFTATGRWPRWTWCLAPAWLLLVPPIMVRAILALRPLPKTEIVTGSASFIVWWITSQWQVIFNRLPMIEELIRLVPGLYSVWLRLWGARIGKFVYWTPGLRILDRSLLDLGDRVVFGASVTISPHFMLPVMSVNRARQLVLLAAPVRIGSDALVGAYSILLAGSWIGAGEITPGKRILAPFTGWQGGRKIDPPATPETKDE